MMLHTKYQSSRNFGFREEDFFMFSQYRPNVSNVTTGWPIFWPQGHNLNKLGRGSLGDATHQISKL